MIRTVEAMDERYRRWMKSETEATRRQLNGTGRSATVGYENVNIGWWQTLNAGPR